jgi:hypothetical protein
MEEDYGGVVDLEWDPNEDHLICAFTDGTIIMVAFLGIDK